jgi:hypothetical protein
MAEHLRAAAALKYCWQTAQDTGRNKRICEDKQKRERGLSLAEQVATCSRDSRTRYEYSGIVGVGLFHAVDA